MGICLYNLESGREEADIVGSTLACGISTANTLEMPQSCTFAIDMTPGDSHRCWTVVSPLLSAN